MDTKNIIFLLAGFAGGCVFMKYYTKSAVEKQLDDAYREMDLALQKEYAAEEKSEKTNLETEKELRVFRTEIKKKAYDAYFNDDEESEADKVAADAAREHPIDDRDKDPHPISYEQYVNDTRNSKVSLIYYINADVLTEEGDTEIIENRHDILGDAFDNVELPEKEYMSTNPTFYIRNDRLGVDYEINYDDSDAEFVRKSLGMDG